MAETDGEVLIWGEVEREEERVLISGDTEREAEGALVWQGAQREGAQTEEVTSDMES